MLRKLTTIAAVLVLLTLLAAPLVLAQQGTEQQAATPSPAQGALPVLEDPYRLNASGNVVVNCDAAFRNFAQLELVSSSFTNDPQFQSELTNARDLAQFCVEQGYDPTTGGAGSGSSDGNGMDQYQPNG